jgi:hypothetical protein
VQPLEKRKSSEYPPFTTVKRRESIHAEAGAAARISSGLGRTLCLIMCPTVPKIVP